MRCLPLGHAGASGYWSDARKLGECSFGLDSFGVVAWQMKDLTKPAPDSRR